MDILSWSYIVLAILTASVIIVATGRFLKTIQTSHRFITYRIEAPVGSIHPHASNQEREEHVAATLFTRLASLHIPFVIELAVEPVGEKITCLLSLPERGHDTAVAMVEQLYKTTTLTKTDHELLYPAHIVSRVNYIETTRPWSAPLATDHTPHTDPYTRILNQLSSLASVGEGAYIQWVIEPAPQSLATEAYTTLKSLERGHYSPSKHIHDLAILTPQTLPHIRARLAEQFFVVTARVVISAPEAGIDSLQQRFSELFAHLSTGERNNSLRLETAKRQQQALELFISRSKETAHTMTLSASELSSLIRLPGPLTRATKLHR